MRLRGLNNTEYTLGSSIGRGGEGEVFALQEQDTLVLKVYHEQLGTEKIQKLRQMVLLRSQDLEAHAAWPVDLAKDPQGGVGLVMRQLKGYVPLHMLFTPMDRKRLFPDKGYNFLVHVAKNVAVAMHKIHNAGAIVGDVNEGNILVDKQGRVAFIDCDSFQIGDNGRYHYCEVGVPRYTPPELLRQTSFANVLRDVNTDSFSLAILIFQLLFLGKHPFAGRRLSTNDLDEETAIKQHQFAYSLRNSNKLLSPPKGSFDIKYLPQVLIDLFHGAFERETARPKPSDWIVALDSTLKNIKTCSVNKIHNYPTLSVDCPWCVLEKTQNVSYFLDDRLLHQQFSVGDIESFINGFKVDKIVLKPLFTTTTSSLSPRPVEKTIVRDELLRKWSTVVFVAISVGLAFLSPWFLVIGIASLIFRQQFPWALRVILEVENREKQVRDLENQFETAKRRYEHIPELTRYNQMANQLQGLIGEYRNLPQELIRREKKVEEDLYNRQLNQHLSLFDIQYHSIPKFGAAKKSSLYSAGVRTAADIDKLQTTRIPGIGPANIQILESWRRQVASTFVYRRDISKLSAEIALVKAGVDARKASLKTELKGSYNAFTLLKTNILQVASQYENQALSSFAQMRQAQADLEFLKETLHRK